MGRRTLTHERQPTWVAQHQRILLKILQQHDMALSSRQILTPLRMQNSPSQLLSACLLCDWQHVITCKAWQTSCNAVVRMPMSGSCLSKSCSCSEASQSHAEVPNEGICAWLHIVSEHLRHADKQEPDIGFCTTALQVVCQYLFKTKSFSKPLSSNCHAYLLLAVQPCRCMLLHCSNVLSKSSQNMAHEPMYTTINHRFAFFPF